MSNLKDWLEKEQKRVKRKRGKKSPLSDPEVNQAFTEASSGKSESASETGEVNPPASDTEGTGEVSATSAESDATGETTEVTPPVDAT